MGVLPNRNVGIVVYFREGSPFPGRTPGSSGVRAKTWAYMAQWLQKEYSLSGQIVGSGNDRLRGMPRGGDRLSKCAGAETFTQYAFHFCNGY